VNISVDEHHDAVPAFDDSVTARNYPFVVPGDCPDHDAIGEITN